MHACMHLCVYACMHADAGKSLTMQEVYELRTRLKTCPFSEDLIFKVVEDNAEIVKLLYNEFEASLGFRI